MTRRFASAQSTSAETERITALSDAVFAIAVTFLALNFGNIPASVGQTQTVSEFLTEHTVDYLVYGYSFLLIGFQWWRHHRLFEHIVRRTEALVFLNVALLSLIALLPYPSVLLGGTLDSPVAAAVFALSMTAVGLALLGLWELALRQRLTLPGLGPERIARVRARLYVTPIVFGVSSVIGVVGWIVGGGAVYAYCAEAIWLLMPVVLLMLRRRWPAPRGPARPDARDDEIRSDDPAEAGAGPVRAVGAKPAVATADSADRAEARSTWARFAGDSDTDRFTLFCDAVFAIALTVLALTLHPPAIELNVTPELMIANLSAQGWSEYFLSFFLIGQFWYFHVGLFDRIVSLDVVMVWLNLGFLMIISFVPFATELLNFVDVSELSSIVYSFVVLIGALMGAAIAIYANRSGQLVALDPDTAKQRRARALFTVAIFFLVFALSLALPGPLRPWPFVAYLLFLIREPLLARLYPLARRAA